LLAQIGIVPDRIVTTNIDETPAKAESPRLHATRLAAEKAAAAAAPGCFVLAADTVVAVGTRILGKPATEAEARACLTRLSGRRHHVYTAVTLLDPAGQALHRISDTQVIFTRLAAPQIDAYIATGEWAGKAGGYAIQGRAAAFVRALHGSYSGVVGLPLFETMNLLRSKKGLLS
jgi:septum formation protein